MLGIGASKFYDWKRRYGKINEHNAWIPRDFRLESWEKEAIIKFFLNIRGTFYYLCSIMDGYSRSIVHWEIRETMTESDVEIILQRAGERFPYEKPRVISDNGPQFIARDFKEFIRISGMDHVRISPYYPQSNGKIERWHQSQKRECIRPRCPLSLEDARRIVSDFVNYYNPQHLHSAIGYITPKDKLDGREKEIFAERARKLREARELRKIRRCLRNQLGKEAAVCYT